jgi:hypothetical protein
MRDFLLEQGFEGQGFVVRCVVQEMLEGGASSSNASLSIVTEP